jgi:hypothetical protein
VTLVNTAFLTRLLPHHRLSPHNTLTMANPKDSRCNLNEYAKTCSKMTKDTKIKELQTALRAAQEENCILRERLAKVTKEKPSKSKSIGSESPLDIAHESQSDEVSKLKDVIMALRKVAVAQEKRLKILREKANVHRAQIKELEEQLNAKQSNSNITIDHKPALISPLRNRNDAQQRTKESETDSSMPDSSSRSGESLNVRSQKGSIVMTPLVTKVPVVPESSLSHCSQNTSRRRGPRKGPVVTRQLSNNSLVSMESGLTANEFDGGVLKHKLEQRIYRLGQLESELETLRDDYFDLRKKVVSTQSQPSVSNVSPAYSSPNENVKNTNTDGFVDAFGTIVLALDPFEGDGDDAGDEFGSENDLSENFWD